VVLLVFMVVVVVMVVCVELKVMVHVGWIWHVVDHCE
jgi:hypothetical protein